MKVLVTGNQGYIGTVLTEILEDKNYEVIGYDVGYFEDCNLKHIKNNLHQIKKDIRDISQDNLEDIDFVIHLSGLSNDPLGEFNKKLTEEINYSATIKLAKLAKKAGVKRFIYASSQSMYGISSNDNELDEYESEKKPVTEYAKTKWKAETELNKLNSEDFTVVSFRPSTVFGSSPRLRCDIVFNNFVACAYTTGKIEIKSDGSPWRPVIHVKDVCSAFISGIEAPKKLVSGKAFNVGIKNGNYTVKQLAESAKKAVPGSEIYFSNEHTDPRTYRVNFSRILNDLKEYYKPVWNLDLGAQELISFFEEIKFTKEDFYGYKTNRLLCLKKEYLNKFDDNLKKIIN
jgi:nucleoside-diphosphate-sugar epimerase